MEQISGVSGGSKHSEQPSGHLKTRLSVMRNLVRLMPNHFTSRVVETFSLVPETSCHVLFHLKVSILCIVWSVLLTINDANL